jgi:antitoxin FitA
MATLTIRNLNDDVKQRLRVRAAQHGRSMEEEVRGILQAAVEQDRDTKPGGLATRIMERFRSIGGVELDIPPRSAAPEPIIFDE